MFHNTNIIYPGAVPSVQFLIINTSLGSKTHTAFQNVQLFLLAFHEEKKNFVASLTTCQNVFNCSTYFISMHPVPSVGISLL